MNGGLEFLFWSLLCAIGVSLWVAYEITQACHRHRRRRVLPKPQSHCVAGRHDAMWIGKRF